MKNVSNTIKGVAMIIALFVLGSEADSLSVFIISHLVAMAVFVWCAYDLNLLTTKKKGK